MNLSARAIEQKRGLLKGYILLNCWEYLCFYLGFYISRLGVNRSFFSLSQDGLPLLNSFDDTRLAVILFVKLFNFCQVKK